MPIQFFSTVGNISLKNRTVLKQFVASIFKSEGKKLKNLNYVFCSDDYLLEINRASLNHDYYTDIITFDLSDSRGIIEGEIYISVDRVKDNAKILSLTMQEEFHRVIFHGALHLCGYKDKTPRDLKAMRTAEDKYLTKYFK
jgi:rRNA maturation RNase YbeY